MTAARDEFFGDVFADNKPWCEAVWHASHFRCMPAKPLDKSIVTH